jgi:hypothetical protein
VWFPPGDERREGARFVVASDDATRLADETIAVLERAIGVEWYRSGGSDIDLAALNLCRLRRVGAGVGGGIERGDEAVRRVLGQASPEALAWLASRAISYMDESGFPEAVEDWFPEG